MVMWAAAGVPHFSHLLREVGNLRDAKDPLIPTGAGANATAERRACPEPVEGNLLFPSASSSRCPCGDSRPRLSGGPEVSGRSPPVARIGERPVCMNA
jgi:hypothetical protein